MPKPIRQISTIDLATARDAMESFHSVTGVPCRLINREGQHLIRFGTEGDSCALCRMTSQLGLRDPRCGDIHRHGVEDAQRFGGRYIYSCSCEMTYCASPVMMGGQQVGALVCGPVMLTDIDDYVEGSYLWKGLSGDYNRSLREALRDFCQMRPARLSHISNLLFSLAVYIGENSLSLLHQRKSVRQQQSLGDFIRQMKDSDIPEDYPILQEAELENAVRAGASDRAKSLLNELLGFVAVSTGGDVQEIRGRSMELLTVVSRAAIRGGAQVEAVLRLNSQVMRTLQQLRIPEELMLTLYDITGEYASLVSDTLSFKHRDILGQATDYMDSHYMNRLTAKEVASYVGLSPNYFCHIFKAEVGTTFSDYLSALRVEKSRVLLLSPELSILQICSLCGFEDQSYYIKVFKKYTGTTPSRFRAQHSRIQWEKERSS